MVVNSRTEAGGHWPEGEEMCKAVIDRDPGEGSLCPLHWLLQGLGAHAQAACPRDPMQPAMELGC